MSAHFDAEQTALPDAPSTPSSLSTPSLASAPSSASIPDAPRLPPLSPTSHKYNRGCLLVVAGSERYTGAGVLATLAAERAGAGYVSLATPKAAAPAARAHLLCSPVIAFGTTGIWATIHAAWGRFNAACCGPGLALCADTQVLLGELVEHCGTHKVPLLLDASALTLLAAMPEPARACAAKRTSALVLTPHSGELARLLNAFDAADATQLAQNLQAIVIAKGPATLITNGTRELTLAEGTPALATAGTGDILAGLVASLLAQGIDAFDAAVLGVRIHSKAGVLAAARLGERSVRATDVLDELPCALQAFEGSA